MEVKLDKEQFAMALRLIKKTKCDFTHAERVLLETNFNEEESEKILLNEISRFAQGLIKFNSKKEVI